MDRSLKLYYPIKYALDPNPMALDLSMAAVDWRRSTRKDGGYYLGSFTIPEGRGIDLPTFFYAYLGFDLEERSAGVNTWNGFIYEMDLTWEGITRRRSYETLHNDLTIIHNDESGTQGTITAAQNARSISVYGQKEEIAYLDGYATTPATNYQTANLYDRSWPNPRLVGRTSTNQKNHIKVTVAGYVFTANWQFETAGDATTDNISTWVTEIIQTDCPYLNVGRIKGNTVQVKKDTPLPKRALDVLFELAALGDGSYNPWRFYVDNDRLANYDIILQDPQYYIHNGIITNTAGVSVAIDSWAVKPGIFRDLDYPVDRPTINSWLLDERDFYVEEVEYGDNLEMPIFKSSEFEESEVMAAQVAFENRSFWDEE